MVAPGDEESAKIYKNQKIPQIAAVIQALEPSGSRRWPLTGYRRSGKPDMHICREKRPPGKRLKGLGHGDWRTTQGI